MRTEAAELVLTPETESRLWRGGPAAGQNFW
jgi:hypothetical protein